MFTISHTLSHQDFSNDEVQAYLDARLRPDPVMGEGFDYGDPSSEAMHAMWVEHFSGHLPRARYERLNYLARSSDNYWMRNSVGRICCKYVWPAFFKAFPGGKILLAEIDEAWMRDVWGGQMQRAMEVDYRKANPMGDVPQEMSGLQTDGLPATSLLVAAYGIYPLVLFDAAMLSPDVIVMYVPDRAIEHSQMEQRGAHTNILWHLQHVSDDQWTFDGFRGPKTATPAKRVRPTENLSYIEWVVGKTNERMQQLLGMLPVDRQKLGMTFNRAVYDSVLAASSQLPYMAKSFFFSCLDKLANLLTYGQSCRNTETEKWESLLSSTFLRGELVERMYSIPCSAGKQLAAIVLDIADTMEIEEISPSLLRLYRNSGHGYDLSKADCLHEHSGEINNDISLLATPLILYALSESW
jgi:hypothetical protein